MMARYRPLPKAERRIPYKPAIGRISVAYGKKLVDGRFKNISEGALAAFCVYQ